ncbi:hypothetical protein YSA_07871 [Pseudomonas putida ND6]|uniref:Uncharacterized protein n=1 Tax=Pseudomonas putida ND6 TaxID=231023 RepID=I3UZV6_PSEPU|nr:hypothetical protein YSA_07871 [Pseudomonas putida ND6]
MGFRGISRLRSVPLNTHLLDNNDLIWQFDMNKSSYLSR